MADVNKCFEYTLNIPAGNGIVAGDTFTVNVTSSCTDNPSSITAGTPQHIYLANNDTATVGLSNSTEQIPVGAGYTLTLVADDAYTATFNGESMTTGTAKTITGLVGPSDPDFNTKNKASLALTKSADIPTGIFTNVWTYVAILGISATGVVVASKKFSKK
jgi:multidrug transporter EmrE-like cation transporter